MISYIIGRVVHDDTVRPIILTKAGVGYEIVVNGCELPESINEEVSAFVWTVSSEYGSVFYGFVDAESRQLAQIIASVQSMGPALSSRLVQAVGRSVLIDMIAAKDVASIAKSCKGLGKGKATAIVEALSGRFAVGAAGGGEVVEKAALTLQALGVDFDRKKLVSVSDGIDTAKELVALYLKTL